jgi:hypothetical protein
VFPADEEHKQFVNLPDNGKEEGTNLMLKVQVENGVDDQVVYWKVTEDAKNSKRNDPKIGIKENSKASLNEFDNGVVTGTSKIKNGEATAVLVCGVAGGDIFTVEVGVQQGKYSEKKAKIVVWRKVELTAYEMTGFTHITTHGSEAIMSTYYINDTYVEYVRGTMTAIGAVYCIKYIGLWNHSTKTQRNWLTEQLKTSAEKPTPDEDTKAKGPAGTDQTDARNKIQKKAEAWKKRIYDNMMDGLKNWATDAGILSNAIIALEYCHPKYDSQSPNSDANTSEWSAYPWLTINYDGSNIHPDQRWNQAQSFAYDTRVYILAGINAKRYEVVIAHEIGHITKDQFKRELFGPGDHSASAGLMDTTGSMSNFTNKEITILKGLKS